MKKFLTLLSLTVVTVVFFGPQVYAQSENVTSQSRNLCGDTSGNGRIVSVGNNELTIRLHGTDNDMVVHLNNQATIETSSGFVSISDLKIGDHTTLIGGPNNDGSFTADAVVVCNKTAGIYVEDQGTRLTIQNKNPETYERVDGTVKLTMVLMAGLVWIGVVAFLWLKRGKSFVYLLFFTIFYIYLYKVLDYTLLQFQSLLLLQHFVPELILNGFEDGTNINFIPLATLALEDLKTLFLNILMLIPFGFGLPFITRHRFAKVTAAGFIFSALIELLQLITGFMANTTFRVADVNDLIFNTTGVAFGYVMFIAFVRLYRRVFPNWRTLSNPILRYIADRPQLN